jgi:hypothetical protein
VRLADIMSAMRLSSYAEAALALFMLAFLAIGIQVLRAREASTWERARHLPLEPEDAATPPNGSAPMPHADLRTHR